MSEKIIVIHGEKRLKEDIDKYCMWCAKHRSLSDWCHYKNQRACRKIQIDFRGRLRGEIREMDIFHPTMIKMEA